MTRWNRWAFTVSLFGLTLGTVGCSVDVAPEPDAVETVEQSKIGAQVYAFAIEIEGVQAGYFKSVAARSPQLGVIEFQDGDDYFLTSGPPLAARALILRDGYVVTQDLQDWWSTCHDKADARAVTVRLDDPAAKRTLHLAAACPRTWKVDAVDDAGNVVTEEVTFAMPPSGP